MKALFSLLALALLVAPFMIVNAAPDLKPATKTGIFEVPLPSGARLIKGIPAKPGKEAQQIYAIKAATEQIIGFYEKYLPLKGWSLYAITNRPDRIVYQKVLAVIAISVDEKKGTFTLQGHKSEP
jgi:hypothetical protein